MGAISYSSPKSFEEMADEMDVVDVVGKEVIESLTTDVDNEVSSDEGVCQAPE